MVKVYGSHYQHEEIQSLTILKRTVYDKIEIDEIQESEKIKILGVWFDTRGSWGTHIDTLTRASSRNLYAIRILRPFLSNDELKCVFFALVRSVLEYCAPLLIGLSATDSKK